MHVSDPEFSGDVKSAILSGEIERIRALRERGELDNYILFTNRRVGATVGTQIIERISAATGISEDQIFLAGIEYIERLLTQFPEVIRTAGLEMFDGPLVVTSKELAEVILGVADALSAPTPASDAPVVERVSLARKNELNGMSEEFSSQLTRNYLAQTLQIQDFLAAPANAAILARYEAAVDDFQLEVIAHRDEFASFDRLFTELLSLLFKRDGVLARHRRLTRAILFYMYWHCDLGRTPDASAE